MEPWVGASLVLSLPLDLAPTPWPLAAPQLLVASQCGALGRRPWLAPVSALVPWEALAPHWGSVPLVLGSLRVCLRLSGLAVVAPQQLAEPEVPGPALLLSSLFQAPWCLGLWASQASSPLLALAPLTLPPVSGPPQAAP